jgi:hypothetical protein
MVEFGGILVKNVAESVALVTFLRPHTSMKFPTILPRLSTKSINSDNGHVDPGPDVQPGIGTGAWLTCYKVYQRECVRM